MAHVGIGQWTTLNVDWIYEWMATFSTFNPVVSWLHFWESVCIVFHCNHSEMGYSDTRVRFKCGSGTIFSNKNQSTNQSTFLNTCILCMAKSMLPAFTWMSLPLIGIGIRPCWVNLMEMHEHNRLSVISLTEESKLLSTMYQWKKSQNPLEWQILMGVLSKFKP